MDQHTHGKMERGRARDNPSQTKENVKSKGCAHARGFRMRTRTRISEARIDVENKPWNPTEEEREGEKNETYTQQAGTEVVTA